VAYPNNPIARESVTRYVDAMKSVYLRVAEGRTTAAPVATAAHAHLDLKPA
jgi:hypothetical protein